MPGYEQSVVRWHSDGARTARTTLLAGTIYEIPVGQWIGKSSRRIEEVSVCGLSDWMQQGIGIARRQAEGTQVDRDDLIGTGRITPEHVVIELAGICGCRDLLGIGDNLECPARIADN